MRRQMLVIIGATIAIVALAGSGETNQAQKVGSSSGSSSTEARASDAGSGTQAFAVGDQVKLGDWTVSVNGVTDPFVSSNSFDHADGRFVAVDTTVTNGSTEPESVSSIVCFELRDATGQTYNQAFVSGGPSAPDGEVDPGGVLRGTLFYDVPATATGLTLRFKCDLFSSGSATINL